MIARRFGTIAAVLLVAAGAAVLTPPALLWAKAWAAPILIERAWGRGAEAEAGKAPQPWPWADGRPVAELRAPDHGVVRYVLGGASARVLAFGPTRLSGSGVLKPTVLFGHNDTHFRFLERIEVGDRLTYTGPDRLPRRYVVAETRIADARTLTVPDDPAALVLITCWPFEAAAAAGPERFVVTAWPEPLETAAEAAGR
ncbi:MAG: sortase [Marivibrio sp.]|uniref:sortase domain-containing protein n=1 Tax=Marivibrio sp. TaxID=2039719 RepID=UPI0032EB4AF5